MSSRDLAIEGVVFDVDGVLTNTAEQHFQAWSALFGEVLSGSSAPLSRREYERLVDGRPRRGGLVAVLVDRRILPAGPVEPQSGTSVRLRFESDSDAHPGSDAERGIDLNRWVERKQELYLELIDAQGVECFPDVIPCLRRLRSAGIRLSAASASRNAVLVLDRAGLVSDFDSIVDGVEAARLGLAGKPAPDLFLEAATRITVEPVACALVEDAVAGVEAGVRAGFGLVVGVDRSRDGNRHLRPPADRVIRSLADLTWPGLDATE